MQAENPIQEAIQFRTKISRDVANLQGRVESLEGTISSLQVDKHGLEEFERKDRWHGQIKAPGRGKSRTTCVKVMVSDIDQYTLRISLLHFKNPQALCHTAADHRALNFEQRPELLFAEYKH